MKENNIEEDIKVLGKLKDKIIGVKGFNKDMTCRGMQYEEGKIYKMEEEPKCCERGYHFCENPIDCLRHYSPNTSVYHKVEALGDIVRDTDDTKIATNEIKIGARIDFQTMVKMAIDFTYKHCKKGGKGTNRRIDKSVASNTGYKSVASNTGYKSVSSNTGSCSVSSNTGNKSVASNTGHYSVASNTGDNSIASNTGYKSVASNTGDESIASNTGDYSVASNTGYYSVASNTGYESIASNTGNNSVASNTGDYSVASNTGYESIASNTGNNSVASNTGDYSVASNTGDYSVASNTGNYSVAKNLGTKSISSNLGIKGKSAGKKGTWLVLAEWIYNDEMQYEVKEIKTIVVDGKKIKEDTYYALEDGKFVEKGAVEDD